MIQLPFCSRARTNLPLASTLRLLAPTLRLLAPTLRPLAPTLRLLAPTLVLSACFSGFEQPPATPTEASGDPPAASTRQSTATTQPAEQEQEQEQQSLAEAWALICDAERRSGTAAGQSRQQRGAAVANWIVEHVQNKQARYWFINLRKIERGRREAEMRREASRAGIEQCALADLLFGDEPTSQPAR